MSAPTPDPWGRPPRPPSCHACGFCLMIDETAEWLPRSTTAYEVARLSVALRVARDVVREALAPLTRRLGRGEGRRYGARGARA